jgi:hypothetical protein
MAVVHDRWQEWPVYWNAIWVGTLAAIAVALIIGLIGVAVGMHVLGPSGRVVDWHKFAIGSLIFSVVGAFFAFVVGGWVAGKIAGILHSEPAMLHGAIVWLLAVPFLLVFVGLGAGSYFGSWYGGLAGTPAWVTPAQVAQSPVASEEQKAKAKEDARAARNSALGAVTALLLGLIGSVLGGWMASGEPMSFMYDRNKQRLRSQPVYAQGRAPEVRTPTV